MTSKRTVVGIDIIRSGGGSLSDYVYALAIVRDGSIEKVEEVSLSRLIRILWDLRPKILALDNIYELGGSSRNVIKVLKLLPPDIDVVQVTLENGKFVGIHELINKVRISTESSLVKHKLDPFKTAIALALLADKGIGTKLQLYEKKVKIIVSKGRSGYAGGSRSDKYQRNMRAAVARVVKKIKEQLDKKGLDYDLMIRRSMGGIERALFIVYADRKDLYGIISNIKGHDVKVKLKPVISSKFISLSRKGELKRYLIVGYDPGMESGLAILDLNSRPILITSGRELDRSEIISVISNLGIAAIVATDKNPPPDMVKKLASTLKAQLYTPPHSLSTAEKELIVKEFCEKFKVSINNTHERDALAAAIKAYRVFEQKMKKLQERIELMGLKVSNIQEYKVRLIRNEPLSKIIEDIIASYIERGSKRRSEVRYEVIRELISETMSKQHELRDKEKKIRSLNEKIELLEKENAALRNKIKDLESKLKDYEYKINVMLSELSKDVFKDRKVSELAHRLNNLIRYADELKRENERLKDFITKFMDILRMIKNGELVLVKVIKLNALRTVHERVDEVIYLDVPQTLGCTDLDEDLINHLKNIKIGVLLPQGLNDLANCLKMRYLIPVKQLDEKPVIKGDEVIVVPSDEIKKLSDVIKEVEELKRKEVEKKALTEEKLEKLIETYRLSRMREDANSMYEQVNEE